MDPEKPNREHLAHWPRRLLAIALILLMLLAGFAPNEQAPIWRHLSAGRAIVQFGLPHADTLTSVGVNRPWVNGAWLFDVASYVAYSAGGESAMLWIRLGLLTALAIALVRLASGSSWFTLGITVPIAIVAVREYIDFSGSIVGLLWFAIIAKILGVREHTRLWPSLVAVFIIQAFWSNLEIHSALGPLLAVCCCVGSLFDRLVSGHSQIRHDPAGDAVRTTHGDVQFVALITLAGAAGSAANPYGLGVIRASILDCAASYWIGAEGQVLVSGMVPIWSGTTSSIVVASLILLFLAAIAAGTWPSVRNQLLFPTAVFGALAASDMRFAPYAAVWFVRAIQSGFVGRELDWFQSRAEPMGTRRRVTAALAVGLLFIAAAVPVLQRFIQQCTLAGKNGLGDALVQARLRWLESHTIDGTMLMMQPDQAGWVEFGSTRLRPFLDDRVELFGPNFGLYRRLCRDVVEDRQNAYRLNDGTLGGWRAPHNLLPFHWIASAAFDAPTNVQLGSGTFWGIAYWDSDIVVFGMKAEPEVQAGMRQLAELNRRLRDNPGVRSSLFESRGRGSESDQALGLRSGSPAGLLGLAELMLSLDYPHVCRLLLADVDSDVLSTRRDQLQRQCDRAVNDSPRFELP